VQRKTSGHAQDRHGRRLKVISVREHMPQFGKRFHYHLILEVPGNQSREAFIEVCRSAWHRLRCAGQSSLQLCKNEGALSYTLKERDKTDFMDAIDVLNTYL
jgi:hypothetical protein